MTDKTPEERFPTLALTPSYANTVMMNSWSDGNINLLFGLDVNGNTKFHTSTVLPFSKFEEMVGMFNRALEKGRQAALAMAQAQEGSDGQTRQ